MADVNQGEFTRFRSFHGRNPDVLNSIANLSNDEVFTPPEFANSMLDALANNWAKAHRGENIWSNSSIKFLDPFSKSGVFPREITRRLVNGLKDDIPNLQLRVDHILKNQVFGIATTQLTALMSRRSLYCSKRANGRHSITQQFDNEQGNIWFQPESHVWVSSKHKMNAENANQRLSVIEDSRCKFCGASKREFDRSPELEQHAYGLLHTEDPKTWTREIFGKSMQFDVIIGNPPYQLNDTGGASAMPIYHKFVSQAKRLEPKFLSMVIPARWYTGGRDMEDFRTEMLGTPGITYLHDFFDAAQVFPGIDLSGGVCYFLWQKDSSETPIVRNTYANLDEEAIRPLSRPGENFLIRFNRALPILEKIAKKSDKSFVTGVSPTNPFGIPRGAHVSENQTKGTLPIHAYPKNGFIKENLVTRGTEIIGSWKVASSKAYGERGDFPYLVTGKPFLVRPGEVCSETYVLLRVCKTQEEAEHALSYAQTRFFRFLVLLKKNTQNSTSKVFELVPEINLETNWDDEKLTKFFDLNTSDVSFIHRLVREMKSQ